MQTIILADRSDESLRPLTSRVCAGLLPVAGKPVIEFCIEALHSAGISTATIFINEKDHNIGDVIGAGARWGMELEFVLSRGDGNLSDAGMELIGGHFGERLIVRGDMLWNADVNSFLKSARSTAHESIYGISSGIGVMSWARNVDFVQQRACLVHDMSRCDGGLDLPGSVVNRLNSIGDFHRANIELLHSVQPAFQPRGRDLGDGLVRDFDSQASGAVLRSGRASIGRRTKVHRTVRLDRDVVVGDRVVIDRNATLENTVVLPDTYIGELVSLRNAVVQGNTIVWIDNGMTMRVDDELLLMDLNETALRESTTADSAQLEQSLSVNDNAYCWGGA